ncbi:hypothetical protein SDC9_54648 [bioreactor metagenome]|uniref:Cyclic lactone autoinducer peptide n=1 Tax=bioreactor metagenome TaxID=1076179 RepID=A0A644WWP9_9ZZZZ
MKKFYGVIAAVSTILAAVLATSACNWFTYQPEEPKSLED